MSAYNQAAYDDHPKNCASLPSFKFFYPGGVCCISCYDVCTDCDAPFATEALTFIDGGPVEEDEWLCDCCERKRLLPEFEFSIGRDLEPHPRISEMFLNRQTLPPAARRPWWRRFLGRFGATS